MGKGGCVVRGENSKLNTFTWDEVKKKTGKDEKWIVINGQVYDITRWMKKHPGGARILSHFGGQDATVSAQMSDCYASCRSITCFKLMFVTSTPREHIYL